MVAPFEQEQRVADVLDARLAGQPECELLGIVAAPGAVLAQLGQDPLWSISVT